MEKVQELLIINIKKARSRSGFSQMKLAEIARLSPGFIGDIESGKKFPSAKSLQQILDALDLEPYEAFLDTNPESCHCPHEKISHVRKSLMNHFTGLVDQTFSLHFKNK